MTANDSIESLNSRFAIPEIASIVPGSGDLPKIQIASPAGSAEIYLHGAQLTSWQPAGSEEIVFLSQHSRWEEGRAIRGGIPICFPWFRAKSDDSKAPAHGFVRTKCWQLQSITHDQDSVIATLETQSDLQTRFWWPHEFRLIHRISVGSQLKLELIVSNSGWSSFQFEEALHTYHRVGNVKNLGIRGLNGVRYLDNLDNNRENIQQRDVLLTQATDNAYIDTQSAVEIVDPILNRRIQIEKQNSSTTIVWNPWQDGASALADLGNDEWQQFACVEASNILSAAVMLNPGKQHTMAAVIRVTQQ